MTDHETDAMIQASLRASVGQDVTVITIAHRLQTILDSDKIVRLEVSSHSHITHHDPIDGSRLRQTCGVRESQGAAAE
jgi:ABC-type multidrug transport system fused ATPase/permease subunit